MYFLNSLRGHGKKGQYYKTDGIENWLCQDILKSKTIVFKRGMKLGVDISIRYFKWVLQNVLMQELST